MPSPAHSQQPAFPPPPLPPPPPPINRSQTTGPTTGCISPLPGTPPLDRCFSAPARLLFAGSLEHDDSITLTVSHQNDDYLITVNEKEILIPQKQAQSLRHLLANIQLLDTPKGQTVHLLDNPTLPILSHLSSYYSEGYNSTLTPEYTKKVQQYSNNPKYITAHHVAQSIASSSYLIVGGFNGAGHPEELTLALAHLHETTAAPTNLHLLTGVAQGNKRGRGLDALASPTLLSAITFSHLGTCPLLQSLVHANTVTAHNLPLGVFSQLIRSSPKPLLSHVGRNTDHDPRYKGCLVNTPSTLPPPIVHLAAKGLLSYNPLHADVALLRGTFADGFGNVSLCDEAVRADTLATAAMVSGRGGRVYFQVKGFKKRLEVTDVPGFFVTGVVVVSKPEYHWKTFAGEESAGSESAGSGSACETVRDEYPALPAGWRRRVATRAAAELRKGETVNLGLGAPEKIAQVLHEQGTLKDIVLSTEAGTIGGLPLSGLRFGTAREPDLMCQTSEIFDYYDGGMLDVAVLGLGQMDRNCLNVGKFAGRVTGVGGFAHIAVAAKRLLVFVGRHYADGDDEERMGSKFVEKVESISVDLQSCKAKTVLVVTERCVLQWEREPGLVKLLEVVDDQKIDAVKRSLPFEVDASCCVITAKR